MSSLLGVGRLRILRAARVLFLERGFADVSMQHIADDAGVTKATLYHHFRNKVDLYIEVVRLEHEHIGQNIQQLIAGAASLEEQLERIAVAFFSSDEGDFGRLVQDLHQHVDPERVSRLFARMHADDVASPEGVIRDCFASAVERGEIGPVNPDLLGALFFSMVHGISYFSQSPEWAGKFGVAEAAMLPKILLHGIASPAKARYPHHNQETRPDKFGSDSGSAPTFGDGHDA